MKQYSITCKDGYEIVLPTGRATLRQARKIAQEVAEERKDLCLLYVRNGARSLTIAEGDAYFEPERFDRPRVQLSPQETTILAKAKELLVRAEVSK
jgi:hypothetical protein